MTLTLNLPAIVYIVGVVLGSIVSSICWVYRRNTRSSMRLLGASVFSLTWTLFVFFTSESQLIMYLPHLFHTGYISTLLYMPFSYFFIRQSTLGVNPSYKDLVHALPLILFLIDYSAIFFLSANEKVHLMEADKNSAYVLQQGWFIPMYLQRPVRFVLFLLYAGLQFRLAFTHYTPKRKWLTLYLTAQFMLVTYYVIYQFTLDPFVWRVINVVAAVYLVFIAIGLLFHPRILYNYELTTAESKLTDRIKRLDTVNNIDSLHQKRNEELTRRLEAFMDREMPHMRPGYSITDLSAALQIPAHHLSALLNHHLGLSFNEYLNKRRIEHCKERILEGAAESLTLEALAFECGFNNRNSFTSAFKHFYGMTPSEFIKLQKNTLATAKES
ncbi:helix-turn-helix transcriptional regulator [Fulvivirgaceae bacterium PWU4]|uniref:Helix-turn-helix transcriptional regulator n=1 Tax=Chryseosolibacter histidini TaxID=2782349 RepID=A0AAP2GKP5_9BACT|nr:helix-turn-helix domain-containing protein [Chryseosolibacter histidini]MBT1699531.1 helix-turn-helix transcriptional regulator [Chryseosolibacter histidini]